jgi:ferric-dicitrate binding protein FerR (iron transport regulator)
MNPAEARSAFGRWLDGDLAVAEEDALRAALAADPALRAACAAEARLAAALAALHGAARGEAVAAMVAGHLRARSARIAARSADAAVRGVRRPRRPVWLPLAFAAGLVALVGVAAVLASAPSASPVPVVADSGSGGPPERRLALAGGGTLVAAPDSEIRSDGGVWRLERGRVEVEAGPHSGTGAVVVRTAEAACRVVGTRFSVGREPGRTTVTVAHGMVAVEGSAGAVHLPTGGRAVATAGGIVADLAWMPGDPAPPWLALGRVGAEGIAAVRFPDRFATLGIDLKPLQVPLRSGTAIDLRVRLGGDVPALELWCRTTDGGTWVWEEHKPSLGTWLDRRVLFSAFRDDATRSAPPPPGSVVDWMHVSTRDGSGRTLVAARLAVVGWGVPAAP